MSLGELVGELKGHPKKKPRVETELGGQVTPDGEIKLDTADIEAITAELKKVRNETARLKKEEDRLKALLLAHPQAKAGFCNSSIEIEGTSSIDLENPALLAALMKKKVFTEACNLSLSQPKVRKLAEKHAEISAAVTMLHGRRIKTVKG